MKKFLDRLKSDRILINIFNGASAGLLIWILDGIFNRFFGLVSPFFIYIPQFLLVGMIVGAVIGMISNEILSHKQK